MALDLYDGTEQDPYFVSADDRSARGRLWAIEKAIITLAAAGIVQIFKGGGTDPTVLTGYGVTKLWLKVEAGVTDTPGEVRVYDGSGSASDIANWPLLTAEGAAGLRRHLDVYSKAEIDAKTVYPFGSSSVDNQSGVSGAKVTDALNALAALDALKVPLTQRGAANGVATLDGSGKVPTAQLPASAGMDIAGLSAVSGGLATLDRFPVYDVSGTVNGYVVAEDILKVLNLLTADSSPVMADDYVLAWDASAGTVKKVLMKYIGAGKKSLWLPAGAWRAVTTGSKTAAATTTNFDSGANDLTFPVLSFSATVDNYAWCSVKMPNAWDRQSVTFRVVFMNAAASTGAVLWRLGATACGSGAAIDASPATQDVTTTVTSFSIGVNITTSESSSLVIAGSPQVNDLVTFQIARMATAVPDTATAAALLVGVEVIYTDAANTDN